MLQELSSWKESPLFLRYRNGRWKRLRFARANRKQNYDVIFTTISAHALKAIKFGAIDYLLKPIDGDELKVACDKLKDKKPSILVWRIFGSCFRISKTFRQYSKITLPTGNAYEIVSVKDIIRCEADGSYTTFFHRSKRNYSFQLLQEYKIFFLPMFLFMHHHHLINMNHVVRFLKTDGGCGNIWWNTSEISRPRKKRSLRVWISQFHLFFFITYRLRDFDVTLLRQLFFFLPVWYLRVATHKVAILSPCTAVILV